MGKQQVNNGVLLLNTESMDRETAHTTSKNNGSNHKRIVSNANNFVKVQNCEVASADANNYSGQIGRGSGGIPHTLGNSLGGQQTKQSLNMSNYGGYFSAI